jgi:SAM-dependent methyltransferase
LQSYLVVFYVSQRRATIVREARQKVPSKISANIRNRISTWLLAPRGPNKGVGQAGGLDFDPSFFFRIPLVDLGETDKNFRGIYAPRSEIGTDKIGITDQFLSNAQSYHEAYSASDHFTRLFRSAISAAQLRQDKEMCILDIGSGSGSNTVIPCLRLFDGCRIIATDLSPNLLRLLRQYIVQQRLEERVACVCTDAMSDNFRPGVFDMVVGASILHHLIDPQVALAAAYRALRPGGAALFFEPFEGWGILGLTFTRILDRAEREGLVLNDGATKLLRGMRTDLAARTGTDKSAPRFRHMDDKWLFTNPYVEASARRAGFDAITMVPQTPQDLTHYYRSTVAMLLGLKGMTPDELPDWVWQEIDLVDTSFSREMKLESALERTIVLRKPE